MGVVGMFVGLLMGTFYEPVLGAKLAVAFDYDSDQVAYFYSIYTLATFLANLALTFAPIKSKHQIWVFASSLLAIIGALLMGPSRLLGLPDNLLLMAAGMAVLGLSAQVFSI